MKVVKRAFRNANSRRRRRVFLCALAALAWIACGGPPKGVSTPPQSDAGLRDDREAAQHSIASDPLVRVLVKENFNSVEIGNSSRGRIAQVVRSGNQLRLLAAQEGRPLQEVESGSGFRFESAGQEFLQLDGRSYRGALEVFVNPVGALVAVNELALEEYLLSVVPLELGPAMFPYLESLKAQAVAARTFAYSGIGRRARYGFDVYADTRSQVYGGPTAEHPLSTQAVSETRSVGATWRGQPIVALYSSTCGGTTEAFDTLFSGGPLEYLNGGVECRDASSRYHTWVETISAEAIEARLTALGAAGRLQNLQIERRSPHGRAVRMRFETDRSTLTLLNGDIRDLLELRSNWITDLQARRDSRGNVQEVRVIGKGFGHGVGLCQIGAVEQARDGRPFDQILRHYYHGIELNSLY